MVRPQGFAAPYGIWNPGLAEAIDVSGFAYSSEFSYAFDTLPFYPESNGVRWKALQVPVHPVCIGTMMRAGYPEISMREYFDRMVAVKTLRSEPLFFYHHPSHTHWDVVGHLFDSVDREGIGWCILADFARWWRLREAAGLEGSISGDQLSVEGGERGGDFWYEITMPDRHYLRQPFGQNTVDLRAWRSWRTRPAYASPGDIRRIREFDLRTSLGDLYNTLLRKMP